MVTETRNETGIAKKGVFPLLDTGKKRNRKSERLSDVEHLAFKEKVDKELYLLDAVEKMLSTDKTVKRIYKTGIASPESIQKAREYINQ